MRNESRRHKVLDSLSRTHNAGPCRNPPGSNVGKSEEEGPYPGHRGRGLTIDPYHSPAGRRDHDLLNPLPPASDLYISHPTRQVFANVAHGRPLSRSIRR